MSHDAVYLVSPQPDAGRAAALTEGVDAPAETEAGAAASAPSDQRVASAPAPRRYRMRRGLLAALAIAVLVSVIVIERHTLAESLHVLADLNWAWFLLAVAAELVSLTAFGFSRKLLLQVNGRRASFTSVMAITYAANALSISVPFAGAELAMVFSYRQFRRHGVDAATTGWMLAVSAIFSTSALALLLVIGAIAGNASLASAAGFLGAFIFIVPAVTVLLALRYQVFRKLVHHVIAWLVGFSRRAFGVPAQGVDALGRNAECPSGEADQPGDDVMDELAENLVTQREQHGDGRDDEYERAEEPGRAGQRRVTGYGANHEQQGQSGRGEDGRHGEHPPGRRGVHAVPAELAVGEDHRQLRAGERYRDRQRVGGVGDRHHRGEAGPAPVDLQEQLPAEPEGRQRDQLCRHGEQEPRPVQVGQHVQRLGQGVTLDHDHADQDRDGQGSEQAAAHPVPARGRS